MKDIYEFKCYATIADEDRIYETKPKEPHVIFILRHPEWWRYDQIIDDEHDSCFFHAKQKIEWNTNDNKKRRKLLQFGLVDIQTSSKVMLRDDQISEELMELLAVYYSEKVLISNEERERLEKDLKVYNDPKQKVKLKPPFHRMIIEMDIMRRIGG